MFAGHIYPRGANRECVVTFVATSLDLDHLTIPIGRILIGAIDHFHWFSPYHGGSPLDIVEEAGAFPVHQLDLDRSDYAVNAKRSKLFFDPPHRRDQLCAWAERDSAGAPTGYIKMVVAGAGFEAFAAAIQPLLSGSTRQVRLVFPEEWSVPPPDAASSYLRVSDMLFLHTPEAPPALPDTDRSSPA